MYCDFFGWIWFLTVLFSSYFVYWVAFSTLNDALTANAIFRKLSLTIKGYWDISLFLGRSAIYTFKSVQYICQFTLSNFHITPSACHWLSDWPFLKKALPLKMFGNLKYKYIEIHFKGTNLNNRVYNYYFDALIKEKTLETATEGTTTGLNPQVHSS